MTESIQVLIKVIGNELGGVVVGFEVFEDVLYCWEKFLKGVICLVVRLE